MKKTMFILALCATMLSSSCSVNAKNNIEEEMVEKVQNYEEGKLKIEEDIDTEIDHSHVVVAVYKAVTVSTPEELFEAMLDPCDPKITYEVSPEHITTFRNELIDYFAERGYSPFGKDLRTIDFRDDNEPLCSSCGVQAIVYVTPLEFSTTSEFLESYENLKSCIKMYGCTVKISVSDFDDFSLAYNVVKEHINEGNFVLILSDDFTIGQIKEINHFLNSEGFRSIEKKGQNIISYEDKKGNASFLVENIALFKKTINVNMVNVEGL